MPGADSSPQWLKTLRDFAVWDTRSDSGSDPALTPIKFPPEALVCCALTTAYDEPTYSPDIQRHHVVRIYWEYKEKLFLAHLTYVKGDPKGAEHERDFLEIVRSIRPLRQ